MESGSHEETNMNDYGHRVKMQGPLPNIDAQEVKYYACSRLNHHMHRQDGKRLTFIHGIYRADNVHDQKYLDHEISDQNPYVRRATDTEIEQYSMRVDPHGTIARELTSSIAAKVHKDFKEKLQQRVNDGKLNLTDEQIEQLTSDSDDGSIDLFTDTDLSAKNLADVDQPNPVRVIETGSGRLVMGLGGITGTNKLAGAATSNTQNK